MDSSSSTCSPVAPTPIPNKKRKRPEDDEEKEDTSALQRLLGDDELLQVLLRLQASDFVAVFGTCRRFRAMLTSKVFTRERVAMGWVQVQVVAAVPAPEEDDEESASSTNNNDQESSIKEADIVVDRQIVGKIHYCLVARDDELYQADGLSLDLVQMFFDCHGHCRIPSIKRRRKPKFKPILFVTRMQWKNEYCDIQVVGLVMRRFLLDMPDVSGNWSICIYQTHWTVRCPRQEKRCLQYLQQKWRPTSHQEDEEFLLATRQRVARMDDMRDAREVDDVRGFLQAGFEQVPETLLRHGVRTLFAVPSVFDKPVLSPRQADAIEVPRINNASPAPFGINSVFLYYVDSACRKKRDLRCTIERNTGATLAETLPLMIQREIEDLKEYNSRDELSKRVAFFEAVQNIYEYLDYGEPYDDVIYAVIEGALQGQLGMEPPGFYLDGVLGREDMQTIENTKRSFELSLNIYNTVLQEYDSSPERFLACLSPVVRTRLEAIAAQRTEKAQAELSSLLVDFTEKLVEFVNEKGASIQESFVVHACAANSDAEFLEQVLSLLSEDQTKAAVNQLDSSGATPLMVGACVEFFDEQNHATLAKLLHHGACKDTIDRSGESALGKLRRAQQMKNDSLVAFLGTSFDSPLQRNRSAEALLIPSNGATAADDSYLLQLNNDEEEFDEGSE